MKRIIDIVVSFILLVLLFPVILLVGLLIRFRLGKDVLFFQERPGLHSNPFKLIKFRTMAEIMDKKGDLLPDYMRLTSFGKLLRSTSLDELPSLWNVLKGDMSLVGPRPLLMEYLPLYNNKQARRHEVRPGITGWAQVNGRNAISWEEKFKLDVWYVDHQSLWLDVRILLLTVKKVFSSSGIAQEGHVTMPKFEGNRH